MGILLRIVNIDEFPREFWFKRAQIKKGSYQVQVPEHNEGDEKQDGWMDGCRMAPVMDMRRALIMDGWPAPWLQLCEVQQVAVLLTVAIV